ncbi:amidohydrolase [Lentisalinibacter salinarum]|uniref:amidohydrolase n=1 Tax=Lentisalinibacter salinarum TaxID=2992239 RepID=UPI0038694BD1
MKPTVCKLANRLAATAALVTLAWGCSPSPEPVAGTATGAAAGAEPAELILSGGTIVTLTDPTLQAGAVAIRNGRIQAVGTAEDIAAAWQGPGTVVRELGGRTVLPGFIDAHGHFLQVGFLAQSASLLPRPDGGVTDFATLAAALQGHRDSDQAAKMGWIVGMGYDDAQLAEQRHPTAADLDAMISDMPVLLIHQSGHVAAVNSAGLEALGITAASQDPPGGVIRRKAGSREPDGVLEETAFFATLDKLPLPEDPESFAAMVAAAQESYAAAGFTTAQEGRALPANVRALQAAAKGGLLQLDIDVYPDPTFARDAAEFDGLMANASRQYENHLRIPGIKLSLDGSPQAKTAWLSLPYHVAPHGQDDDYRGYPQLEDDYLATEVRRAFENGWQVLTHVNGDAAIDQFLAAVGEATEALGPGDRRPVAIHAQTAREDQLDAMGQLGVIPSFMSVHTFYWGDWHRDSVLGPERAARISPARSALERGIVYTSHNDAPVTPPNSRMILYSQVNRLTRSGQVLGAEQRVTARQALEAITSSAARQLFEEERKGTIEPGKLADLVIVDRNPLTIPPEELMELAVLETIKEGETIWRRGAETATAAR